VERTGKSGPPFTTTLGLMLGFIKRLFAPKLSLQHPVFGQLTLESGKKGPYWMHDSYSDDEPSVSVDTVGAEPPSPQQVAFYQSITGDLDAAFAKVSGRMVPEYEKLLNRTFPQNWREAFAFAGVGVPLGGDAKQPWDIVFQLRTNNLGYVFTCYFENGKLTHLGIDT